jgi:methionine-rich copper-binding protein CopC
MAVVGLAMLSGAGLAQAAPRAEAPAAAPAASQQAAAQPIGLSPATDVVAKAPLAVSVTFNSPLRAHGARLLVISESGHEVGKGAVTTDSKTLRRRLHAGAPAGDYTIKWRAIAANGHRMSGVFSFTAARGNTDPVATSTNRPGETAPGAVGRPTEPAEPSAPTESPATPAAVTPTAQPSDAPQPTDSTMALAEPDFTFPATASGPTAHTAGQADQDGSGGFTVVPLIVGALLVIAAGVIARLNRPRIHA